MPRQPFLHDSAFAFLGAKQVWSPQDGQIRHGEGFAGFFDSDVRVVSEAILTVDGEEPEIIATNTMGSGSVDFLYTVRSIDEPGADPMVTLRRERSCGDNGISEVLELEAQTLAPVSGVVEVVVASDLGGMDFIKSGRTGETKTPETIEVPTRHVVWRDAEVTVDVFADADTIAPIHADRIRFSWPVVLMPGRTEKLSWSVTATVESAILLPPPDRTAEWDPARIAAAASGDRQVERLVERALDDLASLRSTMPGFPDVFLAAGVPWFQTLFGRSALWAGQMLLPHTWKIAAGGLRTLARLQGTRVGDVSGEEPGKILHEIRRATRNEEQAAYLPPLYYGTIDATPLWISLLHDAYRAGMPEAEVAELLPHLERALAWIRDHGDQDGDGFVEYIDRSGRGLSNQGWKDSWDAVQFADGRQANGPVALVEVQGYVYRSLHAGATLLDTFGRPGADEWRGMAASLKKKFHDAFWVEDELGPYLAIALDGDKRPVDAVTSNMGHVIGSGLLDDDQVRHVVERLTGDDMFSGFGIRTMSTRTARYWPLRYHCGTVWPHDTVIIARYMFDAGYHQEARMIARGLLDAAEDFDYRLPELFSGLPRSSGHAVPYPASCPVLDWTTASALALADILVAEATSP